MTFVRPAGRGARRAGAPVVCGLLLAAALSGVFVTSWRPWPQQQLQTASQADAEPGSSGGGGGGSSGGGPVQQKTHGAGNELESCECPEPPHGAVPACPPVLKCPDPPAATQSQGGMPTLLEQYDAGRVQRLWDHTFFLPRRSLDRGLHSMGDRARMRRFVHKLLSGQRLSVAVLGGSVTAGNGAYAREEEDRKESVAYVPRFERFLQGVSPGTNHTVKNSALSGVSSGVFAVCANDQVSQDVDMVVLEFGMNDPTDIGDIKRAERLGFERLVRKLLDFPNRPAVVVLNHYAYIIAGGSHNTTGDYVVNAENEMNVYGQFYGLPLLSIRAAAYQLMRANATGFKIHMPFLPNDPQEVLEPGDDFFYYDTIHPYGKTGHRALSDLLVALVQQTALELVQAPLGEADEQAAQEPIQEPMVPGNYHRRTSTCTLLRDFEPMVVEQQGFEWRNERPDAFWGGQKWGWIAGKPGSWAILEVDTTTDLQGELKRETNEVVLTYLRSYEKMGQARVECIGGCSCNATTFDGYWERDASLTDLHRFQATPHDKCRVKVTVLEGSTSPDQGTKVKLTGVIVVEGVFHAYGSDLDVVGNNGRTDASEKQQRRRQLAAAATAQAGDGGGSVASARRAAAAQEERLIASLATAH